MVQVLPVATARTAAAFLDGLQAWMAFPWRAVQVDGDSEFFAEFEQVCQRRGLHPFVLPPHLPKLNGHVERAQRIHTEEFDEVTELEWTLPAVNRQLCDWGRISNTVRPHQALSPRNSEHPAHAV